MTGALLDRMPLDQDEADALSVHGTFMSVHQIYEVVSDNLAIGLAAPGVTAAVPAGQEREEVLRLFNPAAAESLRAMDSRPARAAFAGWENPARRISAFRSSNNEAEHRALAAAFGREHPGEDPAGLEFSVAPCLLANITSGLAMADVVRSLATWDLFITGLARRYTAVQRLLIERPTDLEALLGIGTDSIMVVSTIAYYTGLINEVVRPLPAYAHVLDDGSVQRLLTDAALLVRLVNDVGTRLLEQAPQDRRQLVARLRAAAVASPAGDLAQVLWQAQAAEGALLTRLKKDVGFGEFNVCLDGIRHLPGQEGLAHFEDRLDRVTTLYRRTVDSLTRGAAELRARTGSPLVGAPALCFVRFHQELYRKTFDDQMGDYAVALSRPDRRE
ncbi:hypothetical protein [Streptomyces sp. AP-93]|uniref:hypothetical protein n=1 Tax=Streptomyces sp. AP-93 TaxID=2929048 RepID=UPI001FAF7C75|nr:hypothetical protein [Streptomyces sp. AP-93]MCJ0873240.1 hypothetical protein [Streptomyces sp. AP-93]